MSAQSNEYNTSMQLRLPAGRRLALAAALAVWAIAVPACNRKTPDTALIGTFHMGEKVQVGPMIYNVLESEWKPALTEGGRAPQHRFLFLKVSITNSGGSTVSAPAFELVAPSGERHQEVTQQMDGVERWLGLIRSIEPSGTEEGYVIFDAPIAAYKLVISDGADLTSDRYAQVNIPVQLE